MAGLAPEITGSFDRPLNVDWWGPHLDGPVMLVFHDRDMALQPGFVEPLFLCTSQLYDRQRKQLCGPASRRNLRVARMADQVRLRQSLLRVFRQTSVFVDTVAFRTETVPKSS